MAGQVRGILQGGLLLFIEGQDVGPRLAERVGERTVVLGLQPVLA